MVASPAIATVKSRPVVLSENVSFNMQNVKGSVTPGRRHYSSPVKSVIMALSKADPTPSPWRRERKELEAEIKKLQRANVDLHSKIDRLGASVVDDGGEGGSSLARDREADAERRRLEHEIKKEKAASHALSRQLLTKISELQKKGQALQKDVCNKENRLVALATEVETQTTTAAALHAQIAELEAVVTTARQTADHCAKEVKDAQSCQKLAEDALRALEAEREKDVDAAFEFIEEEKAALIQERDALQTENERQMMLWATERESLTQKHTDFVEKHENAVKMYKDSLSQQKKASEHEVATLTVSVSEYKAGGEALKAQLAATTERLSELQIAHKSAQQALELKVNGLTATMKEMEFQRKRLEASVAQLKYEKSLLETKVTSTAASTSCSSKTIDEIERVRREAEATNANLKKTVQEFLHDKRALAARVDELTHTCKEREETIARLQSGAATTNAYANAVKNAVLVNSRKKTTTNTDSEKEDEAACAGGEVVWKVGSMMDLSVQQNDDDDRVKRRNTVMNSSDNSKLARPIKLSRSEMARRRRKLQDKQDDVILLCATALVTGASFLALMLANHALAILNV